MKVIPDGSKTRVCVEMEGASGVQMEILVGEDEGAPNFIMRRFTVDANGHTPYHSHADEHVVLIVDGTGHLQGEDGPQPFKTGDAVFVAPGIMHQFVNDSEAVLVFTCTIPK
jgi:quercetin dioxygenase-like cupin family protein